MLTTCDKHIKRISILINSTNLLVLTYLYLTTNLLPFVLLFGFTILFKTKEYLVREHKIESHNYSVVRNIITSLFALVSLLRGLIVEIGNFIELDLFMVYSLTLLFLLIFTLVEEYKVGKSEKFFAFLDGLSDLSELDKEVARDLYREVDDGVLSIDEINEIIGEFTIREFSDENFLKRVTAEIYRELEEKEIAINKRIEEIVDFGDC